MTQTTQIMSRFLEEYDQASPVRRERFCEMATSFRRILTLLEAQEAKTNDKSHLNQPESR